MEQTSTPKWIFIVSALFAIIELMVSVSLWFSPHSVVETLDLDANGVRFVVQMWAVRQFALGCIFAFATFKKSVPMLTISYVFLMIMFIGDMLIGVVHKQNPLIISALVMSAVAALLLFILNKKKQQ